MQTEEWPGQRWADLWLGANKAGGPRPRLRGSTSGISPAIDTGKQSWRRGVSAGRKWVRNYLSDSGAVPMNCGGPACSDSYTGHHLRGCLSPQPGQSPQAPQSPAVSQSRDGGMSPVAPQGSEPQLGTDSERGISDAAAENSPRGHRRVTFACLPRPLNLPGHPTPVLQHQADHGPPEQLASLPEAPKGNPVSQKVTGKI